MDEISMFLRRGAKTMEDKGGDSATLRLLASDSVTINSFVSDNIDDLLDA